mmetsp:Transcript_43182/g.86643  ORF Transcript_43182/g.86643 Transcript_43182/m.86643 type:complete len:227 (+) Transcript_43182:397-1077(+)
MPRRVRERAVDKDVPQSNEDEHGPELHPVSERARDKRRRDDGEHEVEKNEERLRNGGFDWVPFSQRDVLKPEATGASEDSRPLRERETVPNCEPENCDEAADGEALHHCREHILHPHKTAIEERQSRDGHHEHDHDAIERESHFTGIDWVDKVPHLQALHASSKRTVHPLLCLQLLLQRSHGCLQTIDFDLNIFQGTEPRFQSPDLHFAVSSSLLQFLIVFADQCS